jgi:hypothetical protein
MPWGGGTSLAHLPLRPGTLPATWSGLTSLTSLDLSKSYWQPGTNPDPVWPDWGAMAVLELLDLSNGCSTAFNGEQRVQGGAWPVWCLASKLMARRFGAWRNLG